MIVLRLLTLIVTLASLQSCTPAVEQYRITLDTQPNTEEKLVGEYPLSLGSHLLVNGKVQWKDGIVYVPSGNDKPMPLLIWLHGGGSDANAFRYMLPLAESHKVVLVLLDARHNTWDGIDSPFGPDVVFINKALNSVLAKTNINRQKIALGGLSDGASYALAIGRTNGDIFTHIIAASPWFLTPPGDVIGNPDILVVHGINDNVYPVVNSRHVIVPWLEKAGHQVDYIEFDGPHWVPEPVADQILAWLSQN